MTPREQLIRLMQFAPSDVRYLLDQLDQERRRTTEARRVCVEQARRLSRLGADRSVLLEEVAHLQATQRLGAEVSDHESDDLDVVHALRELHQVTGELTGRACSGPLVVTRYGHDGRPEPRCWGEG